jgi:hypothetical protein
MLSNKYYTPNFDKVLAEANYVRFGEHPIYIQKCNNDKSNGEKPYYRIIFDLIHKDYSKLQETWVDKISEERFKEVTLNTIRNFCYTISEDLKYETLLMLTADFYSHNNDLENFNKAKELFNQISFRDYETGK